MKIFITLALVLAGTIQSFADVVLGDENINLTEAEVKQLFQQRKEQSEKQRRSSARADAITVWLQNAKSEALDQMELNGIDQAIQVVRVLDSRITRKFDVNTPTPRSVKQGIIDSAVEQAQEDVARKTANRDTLVADGAEQSEIDTANAALASAETILTTSQSARVEDFIVAPVEPAVGR